MNSLISDSDLNILLFLKKIHGDIKQLAYDYLKPNIYIYDVRLFIESEINKNNVGIAFPIGININNCVAHFSPFKNDKTKIKIGDLITIDFGIEKNGFIIDSAFTKEIKTNKHYKLINSAKLAVETAIKEIKPCKTLDDIGKYIHNTVRNNEMFVIKELNGHSIGKYKVHSGKTVPCHKKTNVDFSNEDISIKKGEIYAIEVFTTYTPQKLKQDENIHNISHFCVNNKKNVSQIPIKELKLEYLKILGKWRTLPFHLDTINTPFEIIEYFLNNGFLIGYPPLYIDDYKNNVSAHWEHTILITKDGEDNIILSSDPHT